MANIIAPEHLEIKIKGAEKMVKKIKNAGSIFIGQYSPEAVGDYLAGPNHVLPTSGSTMSGIMFVLLSNCNLLGDLLAKINFVIQTSTLV